jgi:hypothetical protein
MSVCPHCGLERPARCKRCQMNVDLLKEQGEAMMDKKQRAREWYEKGLENLSLKALATCDPYASEYQKRHAKEVLTRKLGPLLAAGQAMTTCSLLVLAQAREQYRTARKAFLEGSK